MRVVPVGSYFRTLPTDAQIRLENSMARTERGFPIDLVTFLIPDKDRSSEGRELRSAEMYSRITPTGFPWLDEAEDAQYSKIGPYSIMLPFSERIPQIESYFKPGNVRIDRSAAEYATSMLSQLIDTKLATVGLDTAFDHMPKNTNLGLPYVSRDKEYLPRVLDKARDVRRQGYKVEVIDPAIVYWRGQPRGMGEIPKQRTVWGFPHWLTILELCVQIPLLERLKRQMDFCAWVGVPATNEAVTTLLDSADQPLFSVDFSGFDASVPGYIIEQVFSLFRRWFRQSDQDLIFFLERAFLQIGLYTPRGIWTGRTGAIPSGSVLTNAVGGLCQKWIMYYVAARIRNEVVHHLVQGDDGVVSWRYPWQLEEVIAAVSELGMTISSDKGGVSRERVYYLQNIHSIDWRVNGVYAGVRPFMRIANGAFSRERPVPPDWNAYVDTLSLWQRWENGKFHPQFGAAVKLLYEWDKFSRELTPAEVLKKAGGMETVISLLKERSFPTGVLSVRGLYDFAVVKELQALRERA